MTFNSEARLKIEIAKGTEQLQKIAIVPFNSNINSQFEYQVRNFWQTRDLRETTPVMEKVAMVTEKKEVEVKKLPYNLEGVQEAITKRFKK